jgi:S1-C subfamily serine protease
MRRLLPLFLLLPLIVLVPLTALADTRKVERAVVHITTFSQRANWDAPWEMKAVSASTGTGFSIGGGRIMTNAHVVADARVVQLRRYQDATPYAARVEFVAHECDLAVLKVDDPLFYKDLPVLPFAKGVPAPRTTVRTYGYPTGGRELSSTEGVVSRYEYHTYAHNQFDSFPTVQTDAAINPGNSGGPVVLGGEVVGVAFQGRSDLQGMGYFIPVPMIEHFLKDVADGRYDGFPDLGIQYTDLQSPAYRRFLGLPAGSSGVVVDQVHPRSAADGLLKKGDVLIEVDGLKIDNDGKIPVGDAMLAFGYAFDRRQVGEKVPMKIWRNGAATKLDVPARRYEPFDRSRRKYDTLPRYFVYAGLVFQPLDIELLSTWRNFYAEAPRRLVWNQLFKRIEQPETAHDEVVVLTRRLPDPVNSQLAFVRNVVVDEVNGKKIRSLADVVAAFEAESGPRHVITFQGFGEREVLGREEAARAHAQILRTYNVSADRRL